MVWSLLIFMTPVPRIIIFVCFESSSPVLCRYSEENMPGTLSHWDKWTINKLTGSRQWYWNCILTPTTREQQLISPRQENQPDMSDPDICHLFNSRFNQPDSHSELQTPLPSVHIINYLIPTYQLAVFFCFFNKNKTSRIQNKRQKISPLIPLRGFTSDTVYVFKGTLFKVRRQKMWNQSW